MLKLNIQTRQIVNEENTYFLTLNFQLNGIRFSAISGDNEIITLEEINRF